MTPDHFVIIRMLKLMTISSLQLSGLAVWSERWAPEERRKASTRVQPILGSKHCPVSRMLGLLRELLWE
ncbi:hypothetical protein V6Z11_D01G109300 [Gossypium hirsutum]